MTKYEFIEKLRAALSVSLNYNAVNDNVRYYEDYIDTQLRQGKSEQEVLDGLGDPRLIAKTIIEANKAAGNIGSAEGTEDTYGGREQGGNNYKTGNRKVYRIPSWILWILVILILFFVLSMVTSIISLIFPILFPVLIVVFVIKFFGSRNG